MNRYGKRCVLYPRVSTEMQVDGYSLEGQKNMLTRFADREEMIVVDTYEDAGKSGKSIEGRPAFQKMLRDIEDGLDIDYILVYKLSRFGRNAADILNSLELVQSYGVNLICIEEGIDSSQTSGKLLISVLSAVAEIERENIIEQTMNGRREKARQGGWNGGFAPYGYTLEDNKLMIEETEAVAIRKIFELYTSSEIGLGGIANQLNLQGIRKIPRQNGTLEDWTGHFIKLILDNPVYCGKIAYGRRTKEKVKGTKNDYQMKRNDDYILTEGQHKGIVSEEVWEKAHAKRLRTGVKQPSKIGRDRVHLLSGLLKCPVCGSPMYTNKHAWTNKDGTYKEIYYYVCSRNRMVRGKHCEYKAMLKKTDIEPMVIEAIREIVRNEEYAQAIKKRIGVQIDTKAVDKELEGYQAKLKEVDLNKTRLEREIDSLPADAKYRERKLHDMTLRLDSLYDVIVELEEKIEDARLRRDAIKQQAITLENIYKIMVNFDCVYNIINDEEKRNVVTALIKEIEIYRNDESEYPLKRIGLNFPVFKDGGEVTELLWDKGNTVETNIYLAYCRDNKRTAGVFSRELVKETLNRETNRYEKLANISCGKNDGMFRCDNLVLDDAVDVQGCCRKAEELFELYQRCANRKQIETICVNFLRGMEATKLSVTGHMYFVPRTFMERVDIFEDFITLLSGLNKKQTPLVVNSFYIIDDAKQRDKMTEEFYLAVKKEIAAYQEKCDYLIKSSSQSPAVMERWVLKVQALEEKKRHYEGVLQRELDGLDDEFSFLKLLSQELQVRAKSIRSQRFQQRAA